MENFHSFTNTWYFKTPTPQGSQVSNLPQYPVTMNTKCSSQQRNQPAALLWSHAQHDKIVLTKWNCKKFYFRACIL